MQIRNKQITRDGPPFIMAEIGVNHDGDPQIADQLIDAALASKADAVKFQLFEADLLLAKQAALVDYQKQSADSAQDLLQNLELPPETMAPLIKRAQAAGLAVIVTPFSPELVKFCVAMQVDAVKLASPDLVNLPLLREAIATNLPLILSTGAADLREVERTIEWLVEGNAINRTILLHCVSSYPTPPEHATLGAITALRNRFPNLPIGYSDHTIETFTAAMAVAAGACLLEKHLTLDRKEKAPTTPPASNPNNSPNTPLARIAHTIRGPIAKQPQQIELQVREQTRQSLTTTKDLKAGITLTKEMLTVKRPGTGIPAAHFDQTLGKKLKTPLPANTTLTPEDLE